MTLPCIKWSLGCTIAVTLIVILVGFHTSKTSQFIYETLLFNTAKCTEKEFQFLASNRSIFNDTDVFKKCGVNSSTSQIGSFNDDDAQNPLLGTKCGIQKTKLISFYKPGAPSYIGVSNIPNIIHYIYYGTWNATFLEYLSFRSADKFQKPKYTFVHGDGEFVGKWWNKIKQEIANVFWVPRPKPILIQEQQVKVVQHGADIIRIQTLQDSGGIYLDTDALILQSFEPLTKYAFTMGRPSHISLANGIMISKPNNPFLCVWLESYRKYNPKSWGGNSVEMANLLSKVLPNLIHVEERSLVRPSWADGESAQMFKEHYDWSHNYAMHIWKRKGRVPIEPFETDQLNSTLGEVMRYVCYGSKDMRIPVQD